MGNSKFEPHSNSDKFAFYSADLKFFRENYFQQSIERSEIPILVDPSAVSYWQNKFSIEIKDLSKLNLNSEYKHHNPRKLSEIARFQCGFATSGSTGEAKIFIKSEKEILTELNVLMSFVKKFTIHSVLSSIPLCHIYGFLWSYALPLELEVSVIDTSSLSQLRKELLNSSANLLISVPSILQSLYSASSEIKPKNMQVIVTSGSRIQTELAISLEQDWHTRLIEIYGSTETGGMGFRTPSLQDGIQFFPSVETKLVDQELHTRSPFIAKELLSEDGFFATKDTGEMKDGFFYYQGRKDRIIKVNGKRVHLDSLEQEISSLLQEGEILISDFKSKQGEFRIGLLISDPTKTKELKSIQAKLSSLPAHFQPSKICLVHEMPKLPNGKKDYQKAKNEFFTI
ncbi:MAG: acyl--CoA ligase [Leptospiraceae bacterium]|nr:acyl--CoA ligase [Leptospiraceae bacterium]